MPNLLLLSSIYAFSLWMGVYLLRRDARRSEMRFAGLGLMTYAIGLVIALIVPNFTAYPLLTILPAVCWTFAMIGLWRLQTETSAEGHPQVNPPRVSMFIITTIFFLLGITLLLVPQTILALDWVLVLIGTDMLLVGYRIGVLIAQSEGESFWPDALRSLAITILWTVLIAGQVLVLMQFTQAMTDASPLLFGIITVVILLQGATDKINHGLDKLFLKGQRKAQQSVNERETLRAVYNAISRHDEALDIERVEQAEFVRLTRRALTHLSDIERLASSPLIYLALIDARLAQKDQPDNTLNRVHALKAVLIERIDRLKPSSGEVGVSDEWRYYNVLYYPYVLGVKPHRNLSDDDPTPYAEVITWLRTQVPERTLHNWQTKASQIIAQDLREQA